MILHTILLIFLIFTSVKNNSTTFVSQSQNLPSKDYVVIPDNDPLVFWIRMDKDCFFFFWKSSSSTDLAGYTGLKAETENTFISYNKKEERGEQRS